MVPSLDLAKRAADERRKRGPFVFPTAHQGEYEGMTLRQYYAGQALPAFLMDRGLELETAVKLSVLAAEELVKALG